MKHKKKMVKKTNNVVELIIEIETPTTSTRTRKRGDCE